ncbi:MAG: adenylate/guanylate cyclase domain-containing protein, partial [Verrucomicrobiaceae bacterium]
TALMISRLVAEPIDHLRTAAQAVAEGRLDVQVPLRRADEFGLLIEEFNRMIRELRDKERLRQMFGCHVGRRTAVQILARDPGLSGVEQVITVMFVDIRSFTQRSASSGAAEIVSVLNEFLQVMVEGVEEYHRGMINKFLGDGFIALFGVEDKTSAHADDALQAAVGMLKALETLNVSFQERGREKLEIGIGLHTGPAIVGSIGSPARLEFTAIGSTVNLASRVEGLTKNLSVPLLITEQTRDHLTGEFEIRELPPQKVKGLEEPVRVFCLEAETTQLCSRSGNSVELPDTVQASTTIP